MVATPAQANVVHDNIARHSPAALDNPSRAPWLPERDGATDHIALLLAMDVIRELSWPQQVILVEHANGPRAIAHVEAITIAALASRGLIAFDRHHRPRVSIATDRGRGVVAALLARWADMLVKAQAR